QQAALGRLLYRQYVLGGQTGALQLALNADHAGQLDRRLHYFGYLSRARARLVEETRANVERLRVLAEETRREAGALEALAAEAGRQRARLAREQRERAR